MKKIKSLVAILLVSMACFILGACSNNEQTIIHEYMAMGTTQDKTPISYVQVSVIVTDSATDVEFAASDFSIVRNGVNETGKSFITGFQYSQINGERIYISETKPTVVIQNKNGKNLQIVFSGIDNITELYYKTDKIALK